MDFLKNLPGSLKSILAFLVAATLLVALASIDIRLAAIVIGGGLLLVLVIVAYFAMRNWAQKRRAISLMGDLQQASAGAPAGLSDINKRAKLEDLRQKFASGLSKFGAAENVYKFPWYLIVGEPGGGKSEAIRNCNVGFPPGMQDELQGVGGTINMNWWFTNNAVFLDTAGRLMFEEVLAGETNEWKEFLFLLKRNRPNCPVNGMLLIIPANSLIKDTEAQLNEKAGKIAQQFDLIQRVLDIRFPVFVVVTKCDLLIGFREFFDGLTDAQGQQQMLGWSNPMERDEPFRTELVTDHIESVVQRIKQRRLSLLRDPIPQKGMERRADEVDAFYSFPQSLQLIAPKLRTYLEKIFVAGPWSPKPLFLRGIYFSSAMREGTALDQELAQALGTSIEVIGETRSWERERAFFLRDLFTEKVFKERGLVTRATNTRKLLRARSIILWASGTAFSLALIAATFYGYRTLEESISNQTRFWREASQGWKDGMWRPIVQARDGGGQSVADYHGGDLVKPEGVGAMPLAEFHRRLARLSGEDINTSWVYRPMLWWFGLGGNDKKGERVEAQRIVFAGGVVSPLLKTSRARMLAEDVAAPGHPATTSERLNLEALGVAALIRVEADHLSRNPQVDELPKEFLGPLLSYATASAHPAPQPSLDALGEAMQWTYRATAAGGDNWLLNKIPNSPIDFGSTSGRWTPGWVPYNEPVGSTSLKANEPIQKGLISFAQLAEGTNAEQEHNLEKLDALRVSLQSFCDQEQALFDTVSRSDVANKDALMDDGVAKLEGIEKSIEAQVREGIAGKILDSETASLSAAYQSLIADSQSRANDSFQIVERELTPELLADSRNVLFADVKKYLTDLRARLKGTFESKFQEVHSELTNLDPYLLEYDAQTHSRVYQVRWGQYDVARQVLNAKDDTSRLVASRHWQPLSALTASIHALRDKLKQSEENKKLMPPSAPPYSATCDYLLDRAERTRQEKIVHAYVVQLASDFDDTFFAPLVFDPKGRRVMSESDVTSAETKRDAWEADIQAESLKAINSPYQARLDKFLSQVKKIDCDRIVKAQGSKVEVSVLSYNESPGKEGLNVWRYLNFEGREYDLWREPGPTVSRSFSEGWAGVFHNFNDDPSKIRSVRASASAADLMKHGYVTVDNYKIFLAVKTDGENPEGIPRQKKSDILASLNMNGDENPSER